MSLRPPGCRPVYHHSLALRVVAQHLLGLRALRVEAPGLSGQVAAPHVRHELPRGFAAGFSAVTALASL